MTFVTAGAGMDGTSRPVQGFNSPAAARARIDARANFQSGLRVCNVVILAQPKFCASPKFPPRLARTRPPTAKILCTDTNVCSGISVNVSGGANPDPCSCSGYPESGPPWLYVNDHGPNLRPWLRCSTDHNPLRRKPLLITCQNGSTPPF
jgi:hypothetical protein